MSINKSHSYSRIVICMVLLFGCFPIVYYVLWLNRNNHTQYALFSNIGTVLNLTNHAAVALDETRRNHSSISLSIPNPHKKRTSCLNDIYDEIFVISSPNRQKTLSITLYQLQKENILFTLWLCHTSNNSYSQSLHKKFKARVDSVKNKDKLIHPEWIDYAKYYFHRKWGAYWRENVFYLRETQMDILKYSLSNNLSKILILEDDILLSNSEYIEEFCQIEPFLPRYLWLNIGVNQGDADKYRYTKHKFLMNIPNHNNSVIKYWIQNIKSWGTFAFALQYDMYSILIDLYDNNTNILPMDTYMRYFENNKTISNHTYNIYPTLIIPDITSTTLGKRDENSHEEGWYIRSRTLRNDRTIFNKYWSYRWVVFRNYKLTQELQQFVFNKTPSFDQIIKNQKVSQKLR